MGILGLIRWWNGDSEEREEIAAMRRRASQELTQAQRETVRSALVAIHEGLAREKFVREAARDAKWGRTFEAQRAAMKAQEADAAAGLRRALKVVEGR